MADYYRTGITVASHQDIINNILSFVTASAPGPAWTEDATFPAGSNPGKLFLKSSGTIPQYVYLSTTIVATKSVLQGWRVPSTANGFGGATGPLQHNMVFGAHFILDTTLYDYVQHLFADTDRCIAVLVAIPKAGVAVPSVESHTQMMYFGQYTPHSGTINDPYPCIVAGNSAFTISTPTDGVEFGFFPESIVKTVGPDNNPFGRQVNNGWKVLHSHTFVPPRNSRGAEAFAYQQDIHIFAPGSEESLSLTGMVLSTKDHGMFKDVTIAAAPYFTVPSLLNHIPSVDQGYGALYLIPKGTLVP